MISEKEIIEILEKYGTLFSVGQEVLPIEITREFIEPIANEIISKLPKMDDWIELEYGLIKLYLSGGSGFKINQVIKVNDYEYLIKIKYPRGNE